MIRRPPRSTLLPYTTLLPISRRQHLPGGSAGDGGPGSRGEVPDGRRTASSPAGRRCGLLLVRDRKSTRLNSRHANISYAVFCLNKTLQTQIVLSHTNTAVTPA